MISMVRIDDRLIHGQVAVMWSKYLGIDRILVISDEIAKNEIQVSALLMAAPSGVKAAVVNLDKGLAILNDPRSEKLKILVLLNNPKYIIKMKEGLKNEFVVNIANYGRIGGPLNEKVKISDTVYLTSMEQTEIKSLIENGQKIIHQPLPNDECINFDKLLS